MAKHPLLARHTLGLIAAGMVVSSQPAFSAEPHRDDKVVSEDPNVRAAKKYAGVPYIYGGRLTEKNPGLDCLGLIFRALQDRYGIQWRSWSVKPSKLMDQLSKKDRQTILMSLEASKDAESFKNIKAGDLVFFLGTSKLEDVPVAKGLNGEDLFVWHTGIASGNGNVIHSSPFDDADGKPLRRVTEEPMVSMMKRVGFDGLIVIRYKPPAK